MNQSITRRRLLHAALPGGVLLMTRPAPAVRAQTGAVELAVESPAPGTEVSGTVRIVGWALDHNSPADPGIDSVLVYAGGDASTGTLLGTAQFGLDRPDIAQRFGAPTFAASGFAFTWETVGLRAGPTTLT